MSHRLRGSKVLVEVLRFIVYVERGQYFVTAGLVSVEKIGEVVWA